MAEVTALSRRGRDVSGRWCVGAPAALRAPMRAFLSEWSWSGSFVLTLTSTSDLSAIQDTALSVYPPELDRFDGRELRLSLYNHLTGTSITVHATVTLLGLYTLAVDVAAPAKGQARASRSADA